MNNDINNMNNGMNSTLSQSNDVMPNPTMPNNIADNQQVVMHETPALTTANSTSMSVNATYPAMSANPVNQAIPTNGNSTTSDKVFCSNCGAPMNSNSRCCLRCGNVNVVNQENTEFLEKTKKNSQMQQAPSESVAERINRYSNPNSFLACTIVTILLFFAFFFGFVALLQAFFLSWFGTASFASFFSLLPVYVFVMSVPFLMIYSMELIYMDSGHPWWAFFVPIYNCMVLSDIALDNMSIGIILYLPSLTQNVSSEMVRIFGGLVDFVVYIVIYYNLGSKYGKNGVLTVLFPWIMIPNIAYHSYSGYVDADEKKTSRNKLIIKCCFFIPTIIFILGVGYIVCN